MPTRTAMAPVPMLATSTSTDVSALAVNSVAFDVLAGADVAGVMAVSNAAISYQAVVIWNTPEAFGVQVMSPPLGVTGSPVALSMLQTSGDVAATPLSL